jgi:hypothetical protein
MPKHPLISIPLDIPDLCVLQTELTKVGELILTVESTLSSTNCRRCGRTITERHGLDEPRLLRHLPILGRVVYLRIRPKRFRCPAIEQINQCLLAQLPLTALYTCYHDTADGCECRKPLKIFADGADKADMLEMTGKPYISGFTTNPTLMRKAGVANPGIGFSS